MEKSLPPPKNMVFKYCPERSGSAWISRHRNNSGADKASRRVPGTVIAQTSVNARTSVTFGVFYVL
jgi:hypothetical protein